MAGDRKEPGLGIPDPDKDGEKTNSQDDFLDLIPERLAPRSRPADPVDDEPVLSSNAGEASDSPRAEDLRGPYAENLDDDLHDADDEGRSGGSKGVMTAVVIGAVAAGIAGWYLFLREAPNRLRTPRRSLLPTINPTRSSRPIQAAWMFLIRIRWSTTASGRIAIAGRSRICWPNQKSQWLRRPRFKRPRPRIVTAR